MVNFWDTSALLPLIVKEPSSEAARGWYQQCDFITAWGLTAIEVHSAVARLCRHRQLSLVQSEAALTEWERISGMVVEIHDFITVRERAQRLVRLHPLKAADALQLAAALVAVDERPEGHRFFVLDRELALAAKQEGFNTPSGQ